MGLPAVVQLGLSSVTTRRVSRKSSVCVWGGQGREIFLIIHTNALGLALAPIRPRSLAR